MKFEIKDYHLEGFCNLTLFLIGFMSVLSAIVTLACLFGGEPDLMSSIMSYIERH